MDDYEFQDLKLFFLNNSQKIAIITEKKDSDNLIYSFMYFTDVYKTVRRYKIKNYYNTEFELFSLFTDYEFFTTRTLSPTITDYFNKDLFVKFKMDRGISFSIDLYHPDQEIDEDHSYTFFGHGIQDIPKDVFFKLPVESVVIIKKELECGKENIYHLYDDYIPRAEALVNAYVEQLSPADKLKFEFLQ